MCFKKQVQGQNRLISFACCLLIINLQLQQHQPVDATIINDINTLQKQRQQPQQQQLRQQQPQQQQQQAEGKKPNIVIILIDDMGINDVSFHGSNQILTPNIDALAYNGILLNRHYVPNLCTPSRATLLTGKYPIHTGTQHHVIINDEPWGLPLRERLMPELFRDAGYSTQLVGKWHLGFYQREYTPTMRGFDHHFGYYSGYIDYYDHTLFMLDRNYSRGLDFRRDLKPWPTANGSYATDVFTDEAVRIIGEHDTKQPLFLMMSHLAVHTGNEDNPMQAPQEEVDKFEHISDPKRRKYAGMVSRLDYSVGKTMRALAARGILNDTVVLLYSDNGAPTVGIHSNAGSNYPFRGQKESPWEGGIRSAGVLWSPLLQKHGYVSQQAIHAVDWLPTLAGAAGITLPKELQLDGVNLWRTLSERAEPQPRRLLHVLDNVSGYSSYMRGSLKYINGSSFQGRYDTWLGDLLPHESDPRAELYEQLVLSSEVQQVLGAHNSNLNIAQMQRMRLEATINCPRNETYDAAIDLYHCEPLVEPCYFDVEADPCERYNLAKVNPLQVMFLQQDIEEYLRNTGESARVAIRDERSNPALHNGCWEWWRKNATDTDDDDDGEGDSAVANQPFAYLLLLTIVSLLTSNVHNLA